MGGAETVSHVKALAHRSGRHADALCELIPIGIAAAAWCGDVHASHDGGGVCTLTPGDTTFALWLVPVGTVGSALCHPNTETLRTE